MRNSSKKSNIGLYIFLLTLLISGVAIYYLTNSKLFEKNKPVVSVDSDLFWNLRSNLNIKISDDEGVKFAQVTLTNNNGTSVVILTKIFHKAVREDSLEIVFPKVGFFVNDSKVKLTIDVVDSSMWNFLQGNKTSKEVVIHIDTKNPEISYLASSYGIVKGGSALVVFGAKDENIEKVYIQTNYNKKFYPTEFYKKDFYASLLAWSIEEKNFAATIIAIDKAKNVSTSKVRLYLLDKKYKDSKIVLKDDFLDGKIYDLASIYKANFDKNQKLENFKFINETLREKNEELIYKIASNSNRSSIKSFNIKPFYPLKNAAAVAGYGDHRFFQYRNDNVVSESYHLGIDLASIKNAEITTTNPGKVVYANMNGIYGNTIIIDHNLGLMTLYSHCEEFKVKENEFVNEKEVIALSGKTGLALGDHLHFGVLVQGIEVRPDEWMDKHWINKNVISILEAAKYMIDKNRGI